MGGSETVVFEARFGQSYGQGRNSLRHSAQTKTRFINIRHPSTMKAIPEAIASPAIQFRINDSASRPAPLCKPTRTGTLHRGALSG